MSLPLRNGTFIDSLDLKVNMDKHKLTSSFKLFSTIAKALLHSRTKTLLKVKRAMQKAVQNKAALGNIWEQLQLFLSLTKDYANGTYTNIPKGSIVAITAGLLYFISPLDVIPDFILGLGFVDDAYILSLVYKQVAKDLEKYKTWKNSFAEIVVRR